MLKVLRAVGDEFEIEDLDEGGVGLVSAETLVLLLAKNEFEGCKHSRNGIEVWYDVVDKYEIPVEVWKPVSEFNVLLPSGKYKYEVSNLGNMRMNEYMDTVGKLHRAKLLSIPVSNSYRVKTLYKSKFSFKTLRVARLVGREFVYNPDGLDVINHLNECKTDDWAGNLSWCTNIENVNYGTAIQRKSEKHMKAVRQYSLGGKLIAEYASSNEACLAVGLKNYAVIHQCCNKNDRVEVCGGFIWRYIEADELYILDEYTRKLLIQYSIAPVCRKYTLSGEFVAEYKNIRAAARECGCTSRSIWDCIKRIRESYKDFIWRMSTDDEFVSLPSWMLGTARRKIIHVCGVRQYTPNGVLLCEFLSLAEASEKTGISSTIISLCCRKCRLSSVDGFIWRYTDNDELYSYSGSVPFHILHPSSVRQYTIDYKFVAEYESVLKAGELSGINSRSINSACSMRQTSRKTAGGFVWRRPRDDEFADLPENARAITEWGKNHNV